MKRPRPSYWIAPAAIGGIAIATLVVTGIGAAAGGTQSDAKQQLVSHPHVLASLPAGSGTYAYRTPAPKRSGNMRAATVASGPEADAIARSISLLTSYCQLQELPTEVSARPAAIDASEANRATTMHAIWSADVVDGQIGDLTAALNLVENDDTYQPYSGCSILADTATATATLTDLNASVTFTGHTHYISAGGGKDDPDTQWQIVLTRPSTTGDWLLTSVGQVSLSGSDS